MKGFLLCSVIARCAKCSSHSRWDTYGHKGESYILVSDIRVMSEQWSDSDVTMTSRAWRTRSACSQSKQRPSVAIKICMTRNHQTPFPYYPIPVQCMNTGPNNLDHIPPYILLPLCLVLPLPAVRTLTVQWDCLASYQPQALTAPLLHRSQTGKKNYPSLSDFRWIVEE